MQTAFVSTVPQFEIKDGLVFIRYKTGDEEPQRCMSLSIFRRTVASAVRTLAEHDAHVAPVVPLKGKGKGNGGDHAASS